MAAERQPAGVYICTSFEPNSVRMSCTVRLPIAACRSCASERQHVQFSCAQMGAGAGATRESGAGGLSAPQFAMAQPRVLGTPPHQAPLASPRSC